MDIFSKHAPYPLDRVGLFLYDLITKWPAVYWATLNAAPTICFAKAHCGAKSPPALEGRLRCVPSGTHEVFVSTPESKDERQRIRRDKFFVEDDETKVCLMVQRLSKEKGTERIFPCLAPCGTNQTGGVKGLLDLSWKIFENVGLLTW